ALPANNSWNYVNESQCDGRIPRHERDNDTVRHVVDKRAPARGRQLLARIELQRKLQGKTLSYGDASQFPKSLGKDTTILTGIEPCSGFRSLSKSIKRG